MLRIVSIISFVSMFFVSAQAQLINDFEYQKLQQSIKSLPTDSVNKIFDSKLNSGLCNRFDSARLFNLKGNVNSIDGRLKLALNMYTNAVDLFNKEDGYLWELKTRLNLSSTYADLREYTKASDELFKVKEIARENSDTIYLNKITEYLAHLFYSQGNMDSAFYYMNKVVSVYENLNDTSAMSRIYNNLAVLYKEQRLYHKALFYNQLSLHISERQNDELATSESYNNLGVCYENLYEQTDSVEYLKKALHFYEESSLLKMKLTNNWNSAIANLARLNRKLGNNKIADEYFEYLNVAGSKVKSKKMLDVYRRQMLYCLNKSDLISASIYFIKYDSILNDIQQLQENDFKHMLANQRKLYLSRKREQEQKLLLQNEQNKRLVIEKKQVFTQTIFVIFIIIVLAFFYYLRQRKKYLTLKNEKENKQLQDAVLRTQMNPHFIFNALTAIQNSILKEDQLVTASYVSRFARLIRQTFDFASVEKVTMEEDLKALTDYIETQKMRFGDKFSYHFNIDSCLNAKEVLVPPMMLQPLVENSINHGFKLLNKKGRIHISVTRNNYSKICFEVVDNGVGFQTKSSDGKNHALKILKNRLALFNAGDEKSFIISSLPEGGTKVHYELSLINYV